MNSILFSEIEVYHIPYGSDSCVCQVTVVPGKDNTLWSLHPHIRKGKMMEFKHKDHLQLKVQQRTLDFESEDLASPPSSYQLDHLVVVSV